MPEGENFEQNQSSEKENKAEILDGEQTAELVGNVFDKVDLALGCKLVDSNVVLTLAGMKGQTELFVSLEDKTAEEVAKEVDVLNQSLNDHPNIRFRVAGKPFKSPTGKKEKTQMVLIHNLIGIEAMTKATSIPGVPPFEAKQGWEELPRWREKLWSNFATQFGDDKVSKEEIATGLIKGYPDTAILDFADWIKNKRQRNLADSRIPYTGVYKEAQPNYNFYPEHADAPDIVENIEHSGNILRDFYNSDWHKSVKDKLSFHKSV